jgi:tRNA-guanine family transglycosylase
MLKPKGFKYVYPTYSGTLFNLTPENQQKLRIEMVQLIAGDFLRMRDVLAKLPAHLTPKDFFCLQGKLVMLTPITSTAKRTRGCEEKGKVDLDCFGFQKATNGDYLELARLLQPDILESLSEEPEKEIKGLKALKRSIKKAKAFLEEAIRFKEQHGHKWEIYAPLHGANSRELRAEALAELISFKDKIGGLVVHELFQAVEEEALENKESRISRAEILQNVLKEFDSEQIFVAGNGDFVNLLEAARYGGHVFEVTFPFELAKKGHALMVDVPAWRVRAQTTIQSNYQVTSADWADQAKLDKSMSKTIDLFDTSYVHDMGPLLPGCQCYCCTNFSRAYVHHLLTHHEMTANVLLTLHNCHVNEQFFDTLNSEEFRNHQDQWSFSFLNFFIQEKRIFEQRERPRLQRMTTDENGNEGPIAEEEKRTEEVSPSADAGKGKSEPQATRGATKKIKKAKGQSHKQN